MGARLYEPQPRGSRKMWIIRRALIVLNTLRVTDPRSVATTSNCHGNRLAHFPRANFLCRSVCGVEDITCAKTGIDGLGHCKFDGRRRVILFEAVAQHQRGGENLRDRIREIFSSDVRGRATRWFVETKCLLA